MKNEEFLEVLERNSIETVDQLIDAIEKGIKRTRRKIDSDEREIWSLNELIKIKQKEIKETKSRLVRCSEGIEMLKSYS